MTANISAGAKKCYLDNGLVHVKWERREINSELNVGMVFD
jgi:hypothetical protein